ncbi:CGNR zinc finger domain-containing protein [Nonomuraea sp. NPDC005983]|uniref:CGNR zinc finger domain-containing protein n=1 Tax=Nonomuraea sp. NPDC005983 TaxID=3155595 RepID=UPI0033B83FC8
MLPPARPEDVTGLPPGIALLHQFANTEDRRGFTTHGRRLEAHDALATPADLERWLREHDLLPPGVEVGQAHLTRAHTLRAALRASLRQDADDDAGADSGGSAQGGEGGTVLLDFPFAVRLTAGHGADLVVSADPATTALARIAMAALTATADGTWHRLRMCPAPDCQWVFYDQSRPGRARWCSPRLCGNRMKTQAYRRRSTAGNP